MVKIERLYNRDYFIAESNTITVEKRDNQETFVIHDHEFDELVIVAAGHGLHIWNDNAHPITCGDILYINHDDRHGYQSVNGLKLTNILYKRAQLSICSLIEQYLPEVGCPDSERFWHISPSYLTKLTPKIDALAQETRKNNRSSIHLAEARLLELTILLYRFRYQTDNDQPTATHQLDMLFTVLHTSIATPFNLEAFCQRRQIAVRSLRRLFKNQTGMSITHYLQQLRLSRAKMLLRGTRSPISMISAECGYEDSNYFSLAFKKETNLTPTAYRAKFIKQKVDYSR